MFFEVLSPIYHSPITIESLTYRVWLGTLSYSGSAPALSMAGARAGSVRPTTVYSGLLNRSRSLMCCCERLAGHSI
jgi:hypothetical protein